MSRLREALDQIDFARRYTRERIATVPLADWFTIPPNGVTNMAWQVGHLAFAQYRLCLLRLRPRTAEDESLVSQRFIDTFSRDSDPSAIAGLTAEEILETFDRVHARIMIELPAYPDGELDLPPLIPHDLFNTRIAGLRYCPLHEMIHCGQIALLRRMFGQKPIW
jgi:DinB superfamily